VHDAGHHRDSALAERHKSGRSHLLRAGRPHVTPKTGDRRRTRGDRHPVPAGLYMDRTLRPLLCSCLLRAPHWFGRVRGRLPVIEKLLSFTSFFCFYRLVLAEKRAFRVRNGGDFSTVARTPILDFGSRSVFAADRRTLYDLSVLAERGGDQVRIRGILQKDPIDLYISVVGWIRRPSREPSGLPRSSGARAGWKRGSRLAIDNPSTPAAWSSYRRSRGSDLTFPHPWDERP